MKPLVSVIIPTYNRARYVCEAVESALKQTYPHLEIFVIDDGSTAETQEALRQFGEKIKFIKQERRGTCAARNNAIRKAKGKYIAFLDDDDIWLEKKIERDINYLEVHPDYGFVFSGFIYFSDKEKDMGERTKTEEEKTTYEFLYDQNIIHSTSLVTMRKDCLEKVGLFDESLKQSGDYDMWLRAAKGYKFGYINECLSKYRMHDTNVSKNLKRRIKVNKQIFNKPQMREGKSWLQRRIRIARLYYYVATFFRKYHRYLEAFKYYIMAVLYCPFIGYFYWPKEVAHVRFTFLYRILRTYFLIVYCLIKALFFPKNNIPSTILVDV